MKIKFMQDIIDSIRGKKHVSFNNILKKCFLISRKLDLIKISKLLSSGENIKLNLGCGNDYKEGWINIDNNYYGTDYKLDFNWDLSKLLLFPDESVDYIFSEHFFEHLTYQQALLLMKDCYRCLKDGGIIRTAMPDLKASVEAYINADWKKKSKEIILDMEKDATKEEIQVVENLYVNLRSGAEYLNIVFREHDDSHKWLYDYEEFTHLLNEAGFIEFKQYDAGYSDDENLKNIERRKHCQSLIVEARKNG